MSRTLSIDFLRTFVAIADGGSFGVAAAQVGRSVSAVSLQINKLEQQVGQALFEKAGRRMLPSVAGRQLLDHARTILAANDAALAALGTERLSGTVRFGVLHDALETATGVLLAEFANQHPDARLEITADTSRALVDALAAGTLDQVIAFDIETRLPSEPLGAVQMHWVGMRPGLIAERRPLPLVLLEEPCVFRKTALAALDRAAIPYRIVLVSASLAAVRAAVVNGLGVTARTRFFASAIGLRATLLDNLPSLPQQQLRLYRREQKITSRTGTALHALCLEKLRERP